MAYIRETTCCGLAEMADVGYSSETQILAAIRDARRNNRGRIFATTTQSQPAAAERLKLLGFRAVESFRNPNTGNTVTIWLRSTNLPKPSPAKAVVKAGGSIARMVASVKR